MEKKTAFAALLLFSFLAFSQEALDAVVVGVSGSASLTGTDYLEVYNCRLPGAADPRIEFEVARPAQCPGSLVVYFDRYDFLQKQFVDGGQMCIVPPSALCKATVPMKLGGSGTGVADVRLVRLHGDCSGFSYEKEFVFTLSHRADSLEEGMLSKIASANSTREQALGLLQCGECCDNATQAKNALNLSQDSESEAMRKLSECNESEAASLASLSLSYAEEARAKAREKSAECSAPANATQPQNATPLQNASGQCPAVCAVNEEQKPFPDCRCFPKAINISIGGNITGNASGNATVTKPAEKPCLIMFAPFALAAFALLSGKKLV